MFFYPNEHFSTQCHAPTLTEEDSHHGCVPAGGQPRGSPRHCVAQLASVGHTGLLKCLVDAIRIIGWQETQQPGTCGTKATQHGSCGTQQTGDMAIAGYTSVCEGPRRDQEDDIDIHSGQEYSSFGTSTQNFLQHWVLSS